MFLKSRYSNSDIEKNKKHKSKVLLSFLSSDLNPWLAMVVWGRQQKFPTILRSFSYAYTMAFNVSNMKVSPKVPIPKTQLWPGKPLYEPGSGLQAPPIKKQREEQDGYPRSTSKSMGSFRAPGIMTGETRKWLLRSLKFEEPQDPPWRLNSIHLTTPKLR